LGAKRVRYNVIAEDWNSVRAIGMRLQPWLFRGQADSNWKLSTSIERQATRFEVPRAILEDREAWIVHLFQRKAHLHATWVPQDDDLGAWFALLQHYGGPSRLLDTTKSFYVAAFFAMEDAEKDAAVWCFDQATLHRKALAELQITRDPGLARADQIGRRLADEVLARRRSFNGVVQYSPFKLIDRMSLQQGHFLLPTAMSVPFDQLLAATLGLGDASASSGSFTPLNSESLRANVPRDARIIRIVLPRNIHREGLEDLNSMNINAESLFPGLDGFARSLRIGFRVGDLIREFRMLQREVESIRGTDEAGPPPVSS
jgi:hypothetical protein